MLFLKLVWILNKSCFSFSSSQHSPDWKTKVAPPKAGSLAVGRETKAEKRGFAVAGAVALAVSTATSGSSGKSDWKAGLRQGAAEAKSEARTESQVDAMKAETKAERLDPTNKKVIKIIVS